MSQELLQQIKEKAYATYLNCGWFEDVDIKDIAGPFIQRAILNAKETLALLEKLEYENLAQETKS